MALYVRTLDSDVFAQVEVLDITAESFDIELSLEMPHKGFGAEHVARELGEGSGVGNNKAALHVQGTVATAVEVKWR